MNGIVGKLIFDGSSGTVNTVLLSTGVDTRVRWLAGPGLTMNVLIFAEMLLSDSSLVPMLNSAIVGIWTTIVGCALFAVRVPALGTVHVSDPVQIHLSAARRHAFDAVTGRRPGA